MNTLSAKQGEGKPFLPVQGFVLAGGTSSRMGSDKALLPFHGQPMVELAVEKLQGFCSLVSIVGNRDDLSPFAPVVREARLDAGPVAGVEAALIACTEPWALLMPVDVPLVPQTLLRRWAQQTLACAASGAVASYLSVGGQVQPAFCLVNMAARDSVLGRIAEGEQKLLPLWSGIGEDMHTRWVYVAHAEEYGEADDPARVEAWFTNVNTPEDLAAAERY